MNLIQQANQKLRRLDIEGVHEHRIRKAREMFASSCIIVTYPPLRILPEIEEVYSKKATLYAHLPFCTGKCSYCGHITHSNPEESVVERYIKAMKREIGILIGRVGDIKVESMYFGGGTPTYLTEKQLSEVLSYFTNNLNVKSNAEITVEASPETLTEEKLRVLSDNHVNRLSIGVQTFNDDILALLGRRYNAKKAVKAYKLALKNGFENINIDLIRGLPHINYKKLEYDLNVVEELKPPSVSTYHLVVRPNTKMKQLYIHEPERFPSEKECLTQHIMIMEKLSELGYTQDPIDWFTLDKRFKYKQQMHKWVDMIDSIAVGVSSYGYYNKWQYVNYRSLTEYLNSVENGRLPVWRGCRLDNIEEMHRMMVFGLKSQVNKKDFKMRFNVEVDTLFGGKLQELTEAGLIENTRHHVKLSYTGILFADEVCHKFYSPRVRELDGVLLQHPASYML